MTVALCIFQAIADNNMKTKFNAAVLILMFASFTAHAEINVGKGTLSKEATINEFGVTKSTASSSMVNQHVLDTIKVGENKRRDLVCANRGLAANCDKPEKPSSGAKAKHKFPATELKIAADECTEKSISMEVLFDYDSVLLTQAAREQLEPIGEALASDQLKGLSYRIEGYTDAVGGEAFNKNLSMRRAESVKKYLTENLKFSGKGIQTVGKGKANLADPANPFSEKNRRVRIVRLSCR